MDLEKALESWRCSITRLGLLVLGLGLRWSVLRRIDRLLVT